MDAVPVSVEAQIRREAYISVLRGALADWPTHREFANHIGRTREYLESLLQVDGSRTPGPETARRIVQELRLPERQRESLLEHMLLAADRRLTARRAAIERFANSSPAETLATLRAAHWTATCSADPRQARENYAVLHDVATALVRHRHIHQQPLIAVEACLLLHEAQGVLNRPCDALFHAKLATTIMDLLDPADYRRNRDRFDHLRVNTIYAEAVTLTSLGLARQAEGRLVQADTHMTLSDTASAFWSPHLLRGRLAATSGASRFSLYQVEAYADEIRGIRERRGDPLDPVVNLLTDVSLARAYVRYGSRLSLKKAETLLRPKIERIDQVADLGSVRRVIALRTYARISWARGDEAAWEHYAGQAWSAAAVAGLAHQLHEMRREYGNALAPVVASAAALEPDARA